MVPYVDAVVAVTVVRVLLFVLHVRMMRESEGARLTTMLVWGMDVWFVVTTGHVGEPLLHCELHQFDLECTFYKMRSYCALFNHPHLVSPGYPGQESSVAVSS